VPTQIGCQIPGALVTPARFLREALKHHQLNIVVELIANDRWPDGRNLSNLMADIINTSGHGIWKPAGQQLIQNDTERIDIRPYIDQIRATFRLLRAGPWQRADELSGDGHCGGGRAGLLRELGQTKIEHMRLAIRIDANIAGLQVAMNDSAEM